MKPLDHKWVHAESPFQVLDVTEHTLVLLELLVSVPDETHKSEWVPREAPWCPR